MAKIPNLRFRVIWCRKHGLISQQHLPSYSLMLLVGRYGIIQRYYLTTDSQSLRCQPSQGVLRSGGCRIRYRQCGICFMLCPRLCSEACPGLGLKGDAHFHRMKILQNRRAFNYIRRKFKFANYTKSPTSQTLTTAGKSTRRDTKHNVLCATLAEIDYIILNNSLKGAEAVVGAVSTINNSVQTIIDALVQLKRVRRHSRVKWTLELTTLRLGLRPPATMDQEEESRGMRGAFNKS